MPRILIADDNNEMLDTLARIFGLYDFEVIKALDGQQAIDEAVKNHPDIIILDGAMPVMDGFEACQRLKKREDTREIPVVFLTANFMELRDRIKGLELGADDYLLKPFNSKELVARIKTIQNRADLTRRLKEDNQRLIKKNSLIENELKQLLDKQDTGSEKSITDPLTGLYTFGFFKERAEYELKRAQRFHHELSLILISFENFARVKENLGVQLFNYLVIKIANFILNEIRVIDLFSFDENKGFHILLPQTDMNGARVKLSKIQAALAENKYWGENILNTLEFSKKKLSDISKLNFTYGIGYPDNHKSAEEIDLLFECAESDMNNRSSKG